MTDRLVVNIRLRMRRAVIYIRVSVAREEMISPELQEHQCRGLVDREGLMLVRAPLMDLGKSGRGFTDRQIAEIIAMAERGEFEVLVLWVWSRFGRNTLESLKNLDRLTELGIEVRAAKEDFDGRTVIGRFAIRQMLNIAELFSDQLSETWKETIARRRRRGLPHANQGRFGYYRCETCPPKKRGVPLETCPMCREGVLKVEHAALGPRLWDAYERVADGVNTVSITHEWHAAGITDPVTGKPVTPAHLYDILDSGFGLGLVRYRLPEQQHVLARDKEGVPQKRRNRSRRPEQFGLYLPGRHEPVTGDRATAERLWDRYTARRGTMPQRPAIEDRHRPRYSVSGRMQCPYCHGGMQPLLRTKKKRRPPVNGRPHPFDVTWRCRNQAEFGNCPDSGYGNLEHIETRVVDWLRNQVAPADPRYEREIAEAQAGLVKCEEAVQAELKKLIEEEDTLADAIVSQVIDYQAAERKKGRIDQRRIELNAKLGELESARAKVRPHPGPAAIERVLAAWDDATPDRRNSMIKDIVRAITVNKGRGIPLEAKYRITATWEPLPPSADEALSTN
ncbi:recombinase family protein [Kitasatospora sp. NPDC097605]|uniref:recombinase family protein n=1 Tax=Kitasatospora sp. NPDC097605 TaxID=3157226 RepID=UPI00331E1372